VTDPGYYGPVSVYGAVDPDALDIRYYSYPDEKRARPGDAVLFKVWHHGKEYNAKATPQAVWTQDGAQSVVDLACYCAQMAQWDLNGDGKADAMVAQSGPRSVRWYRGLSGPRLTDASKWADSFGAPGNLAIAGDFNGDGRTDLAVGALSTAAKWYVGLSDPNGEMGSAERWADGLEPSDQYYAGDFDGDGLTDLAYAVQTDSDYLSWYVATSTGSSFNPPELWQEAFGLAGERFLTGDFDGDGRTDLARGRRLSSGALRWHVAISDGSILTPGTRWTEFGSEADLFFSGDFNGDGLSDLARASRSGSVVAWYAASSTGTAFAPAVKMIDDFGDPGDTLLVGDFSGDGTADLAWVYPLGTGALRWRISNVFNNWASRFLYRWGDLGSETDTVMPLDGGGPARRIPPAH
jgi:hypothetical protein